MTREHPREIQRQAGQEGIPRADEEVHEFVLFSGRISVGDAELDARIWEARDNGSEPERWMTVSAGAEDEQVDVLNLTRNLGKWSVAGKYYTTGEGEAGFLDKGTDVFVPFEWMTTAQVKVEEIPQPDMQLVAAGAI